MIDFDQIQSKKGDCMAAKVKTNNNKKKEQKENKKLVSVESNVELMFYGEHYSVHTKQYHPTTKRFIELEADRLVQWADQEDSLMIQDFWLRAGYSDYSFYNWVDKFPEFKHAHEYAMARLGSRRELGAMTRKFDPSTIHRTLGAYNKIWKQETVALAKMKEDAAANETKVLVIERFPELPSKTPEEVAWAVHKATGDAREYGPLGERKKE